MEALIIYSSFSGKKGIERKIAYIKKRLEERYSVVIYKSEYKGSMYDYVLKNGSEFELILAVGGDGTVHEIVNAVMHLNVKPTIAYIPAGTINDSARTLGLRKNLKKTMKRVLAGVKSDIDVFRINDEYFTYGLACGCLTEISYDAPRKSKKYFGRIAYYFEALKALKRTKAINITLRVNDEVITGDYSLFLALNTRYLAGFKIFRKNRIYLNDGNITLTLIKKRYKLFDIFDFGMFLLLGEIYHHNVKHIVCQSFSLKTNEAIRFNTDGEDFGSHKEVDVEVLRNRISIITSKRVLKRHFLN